jgi:hypothetical protein
MKPMSPGGWVDNRASGPLRTRTVSTLFHHHAHHDRPDGHARVRVS